jgi:purine-binding chemotaxis protein CheW
MCALIDVAAFARLLDSDKVPVDLQALDTGDE